MRIDVNKPDDAMFSLTAATLEEHDLVRADHDSLQSLSTDGMVADRACGEDTSHARRVVFAVRETLDLLANSVRANTQMLDCSRTVLNRFKNMFGLGERATEIQSLLTEYTAHQNSLAAITLDNCNDAMESINLARTSMGLPALTAEDFLSQRYQLSPDIPQHVTSIEKALDLLAS
jgi:hypothetical protein